MIKLLVVDDSPLMRRLMAEIFASAGDFDVAFARDGEDALKQMMSFAPDVITLDVQMPGMDGLACLDRIMVERPCPVVMVSAFTAAGAETTLEALSLGAVDFVAKPARAISLAIDDLAPTLVERVRAAAGARLRPSHRLADRVRARLAVGSASASRAGASPVRGARWVPASPVSPDTAAPVAVGELPGVVLVGTSTGGPQALDQLLSRLPATLGWPVIIAQHMPANFTGPLARRLGGLCALEVLEVTRPTPLAPGFVYVARGGADILLARRPSGLVVLPAPSHPDLRWHPSVDRLVDSALEHVPAERLLGVLMTGMGDDGAKAMTRLRKSGGRTIAEAEETAVVWGMPGALARAGGAQNIVRLERIAERVVELVTS